MLSRIDKKDLEILKLYSRNPDIPQEEVAKALGVSQPSIAVRLRRLKAMGLLVKKVGLDLFKAGLHLAKVDITTTATTKVLKMFEGCPYFLNGLITSGRSNLCLFFMAEDIATLEAIVDNHLRALKEVQNVDFNIVIGSTYSIIAPLRAFGRAHTQPCGATIECKECASFIDGRCTGCPVINQYRGMFWSATKP
ncbi:MAG: Lrp/AsnC family transcriptional regulator [Candidatus Nezhaarchaeales archaeon]